MTGEPGAPSPDIPDSGGTTTTSPSPSQTGGISMASWYRMGSLLTGAMDDYEQLMRDGAADDWRIIREEEDRIREQFDGGQSCDDTEEDYNNFKSEVSETERRAWTYWNDFRSLYNEKFSPYVNLAKQMDDRRLAWNDDVLPTLGSFDEQLRNSQVAQHWKGPAAEGYRRQLGPQSQSMTDVKTSTSNARVAIESSSNIQQVIYNSILNTVNQLDDVVSDAATAARNTSDKTWAERIYTMEANNNGALEWLREMDDEDSADWSLMQDEVTSQISGARQQNGELTRAEWPAATSQSSGYKPSYQTPPPGANQPPQPSGPVTGDQSGNQGQGGQGAGGDGSTYE